MGKQVGPNLTQFVDKLLLVKMIGRRQVQGTLRGFDQFMNLVLINAVECGENPEKLGTVVIRGNSVITAETIA